MNSFNHMVEYEAGYEDGKAFQYRKLCGDGRRLIIETLRSHLAGIELAFAVDEIMVALEHIRPYGNNCCQSSSESGTPKP